MLTETHPPYDRMRFFLVSTASGRSGHERQTVSLRFFTSGLFRLSAAVTPSERDFYLVKSGTERKRRARNRYQRLAL
jgi:hypothetical protein